MIKALVIASALVIAGVTGAQAADVGTRQSSGSSVRNITGGSEYTNVQGYNQYSSRTNSTTTDVRRSGFGQVSDGILTREGVKNVTNHGGKGKGAFNDILVNGDARVRTDSSTTNSWERGGSIFESRSENSFSGTDTSTFSESSTFSR